MKSVLSEPVEQLDAGDASCPHLAIKREKKVKLKVVANFENLLLFI